MLQENRNAEEHSITPVQNEPPECHDEQIARNNALKLLYENLNNDGKEELKIPNDCPTYCDKFIYIPTQIKSMWEIHFGSIKVLQLRTDFDERGSRPIYIQLLVRTYWRQESLKRNKLTEWWS